MNRKNRIVHLISLIAIMVSLFSPILSLPVTANEPAPAPDLTLTSDEDGTPENPPPAAPEEAEVVAPIITDDSVAEPTEEVVDVVPLTAVTPAPPVLTASACAEGGVYSQTASAAVTEGVSYELSPPDAAGNFTATATLTDASIYTWADSGLEGWTVNGSQATSSYTLTLCPIPEPTIEPTATELPATEVATASETEVVQEPTAEISTPVPTEPLTSDEASTSDKNASEISSPDTKARSGNMGPTDVNGALLTYTISADKTAASYGEEITFTITVTNVGTADSGAYQFITELSVGTFDVVHKDPWDVTQPADILCEPYQGVTGINCYNNDEVPLAPTESHVFTVTTVVDSTICEQVFYRGGGFGNDELWQEGSRYLETLSDFSINCDSPLLSLTLTNDIVMGSTAFLNQPFIYTVTVMNTGATASGGYEFKNQLPPGVVLVGETPISSPQGTTCSPEVIDSQTTITCSGSSVLPAPDNILMFNFVVMPVDMIDGEVTNTACDNGTLLDIAAGSSGQWDQNSQLANLTTPITCESDAEYTLDPLESPVGPGGKIGFVHTILNTGQTHIVGVAPTEATLPDLPAGYDWTITLEINGVVYDPVNGQLPETLAVGPGETFKVFFTSPTIPEDMASPDNEWCTDWTMNSTFEVRFSTEEFLYPSGSATVQVNCEPELSIAKTNSTNGTITEGENFNYTVTVTNADTIGSGNYAFSDPLPAGIQLQEGALIVAPAGTSCTPTINAGVTTIDCSGTGIAANNGQHAFTFPVVANSELNDSVCGSVTNSVTTGEGVWAQQDPATSTLTVTCNAPLLTYAISTDKQQANVGDEIIFKITVKNIGTADAGDYVLMTDLATGTSIVRKDPMVATMPSGATCQADGAPTGFDCRSNSAVLPAGESHVYTVVTVVNATTCANNVSRGGGDGNDALWAEGFRYGVNPFPHHNIKLNCDSDLSIGMTNSPTTAVDLAEDFTYDITVSNVGSSVSGNYTFTDELPNGVLGDSAIITAPTGASCMPATQSGVTTVTCSGSGIAANGTHAYSITVTTNDDPANHVCGNVINTVNSGSGVWNSAAKSASSTISFNCPSLELSYTSSLADGEKLGLGEEATITIGVTNSGTMDSGAFGFRFVLQPSLVPTDQMDARCELQSGEIQCAGSEIAMGDGNSETFAITVKAVEVDESTCAPLGLDNLVEGTSPGIWSDEADQVSVHVIIECITQLTVTHEPMNPTVLPGEKIGFVTNLRNDGNTNIFNHNLISSDLTELPEGAEWNYRFVKNGATWVPDTNPLLPGDLITVYLESPVIPEDLDAPNSEWCQSFTSSIEYQGETISGGSANPLEGSRTASVLVNCTELVIDQQVSSPRVEFGGTVTYTLTVTNNGNLAISPVKLFFDTNQAGTVFSNWNIASNDSVECWVDDAGIASCWYEQLAAAQSVEITISADAMETATWQQCAPVTTSAHALYDEVLAPTVILAKVTPPYTEISSNEVTTQLDCQAAVTLEITSENAPIADGRMDEGDNITFTFLVTNPGNVTLYDITVAGLPEGLVWTDGSTIAQLESGESATLTATYAVSRAEIDAGSVTATADVTAVTVAGSTLPEETVNATDTLEVVLPQESGVSIDVTTQIDEGENNRVDAGDVVTITVDITNSGNVTIYDLAVTSDLAGLVWDGDAVIAELPAGESSSITATYAISQDDIDSGFLEHTTKVDGIVMRTDNGVAHLQVFGLAQAQLAPMLSEPVSGEVTERFELAQVAGIGLEITSGPDTGDDDVLDLNETITYTFTITNTGNVTLTGIELADEMEGVSFTNGSTIASLAPGAEVELTATYTVTQADVDTGTIVNCADVTAMDPQDAAVSNLDTCVTDTVAQSVTPGPATPESVTPEPTTPAAVTGLPDTGSGSIISIVPVLWAAMLGVVALGVGAIGSRKGFRR